MTFAQFTTTHHHFAAGIAGWLKRAFWAFNDYQARRATREMLRALDGRTLKDIGLDPDEIDSVVFSEQDDRMRRYDAKWVGKVKR
jgi:uncharacterized protein YjiS (DUF1127 family)